MTDSLYIPEAVDPWEGFRLEASKEVSQNDRYVWDPIFGEWGWE